MIKRQICAFILFAPVILILAEHLALVVIGMCYVGWLLTTPCLRGFYKKLLEDSERMFTI